MPNRVTRRTALLSTLFGAGYVGLRSLASGIPAAVLLAPRAARANHPRARAPQFVVFNTSSQGDPINASAPGTYEDARIVHSPDPAMAQRPISLRGRTYQAGAPWSGLPQAVLDRTCFFHLMTGTPVHPKEPEVLKLMGAVAPPGTTPDKAEMLPSLLSAQLAPLLGTIQAQPLCIGATSPSEAVSSQGQTLPIVPATALKATLTSPNGPLRDLQALRDRTVNELYALYREEANDAGVAYIDELATSQSQVRSIQQSLLEQLASIVDDTADSQMIAAVTLIQMKVTPVVMVHVPFGGDNHRDLGLKRETTETIAGVQTIATLMSSLASAGLADKVTFMSLNVFGRTLGPGNDGGRQHNELHQVSLAIGPNVRGGVVGGVAPLQTDYGALPIDVTGASAPGGGVISAGETLAAFGKTMVAAAGIDPSVADAKINGGKVVTGALA